MEILATFCTIETQRVFVKLNIEKRFLTIVLNTHPKKVLRTTLVEGIFCVVIDENNCLMSRDVLRAKLDMMKYADSCHDTPNIVASNHVEQVKCKPRI